MFGKVLVANRVNVDASSVYGETALIRAACWNKVGVVQALIAAGNYIYVRYI